MPRNWCNLLWLVALAFLGACETGVEKADIIRRGSAGPSDYGFILSLIDSVRVRNNVEKLAGYGSRVVGYPGADDAAGFIQQQFVASGIKDVRIEEFIAASPVDEGASLTLLDSGEELPLYCLWPNLVRTSTVPRAGVRGQIHYVGHGEFVDFNGKEVKGSLVVMDFNTGMNWLHAAVLGARAVIFLEPETTTRTEGDEKYLQSPLDMPRFWLPKAYSQRLLQRVQDNSRPAWGLVKARMTWKRATGKNVVAVIPGRDPSLQEEVIVIGAHYDAISVVPALAPGADESSSLVALLEIARVMAHTPPARTVYLVATSGHYLATAGMNAFLQRHARKQPLMAKRVPEPINMKLYINLNLTSQRRQMGVAYSGWLYAGPSFDKVRFFAPFGRSFIRYAGWATDFLDYQPDMLINAISLLKGITWESWFPGKWSTESEIVFWSGFPGLYFATAFSDRPLADTPLDQVGKMNFANLMSQIRLLSCILVDAVNDPVLIPDFRMILPDQLATLRLQVVEYDPKTSYVPNIPKPGAVVVWRRNEKSMMGVRNEYFRVADENGVAEISQLQIGRARLTEAYILDDDTGEIIYAPDHGINGDAVFPMVNKMDWVEKERKLVVFPCVAIDLYDLVDPKYLTEMKEITILNAQDSEPLSYGYTSTYSQTLRGWARWLSYSEPVGVVFMPRGSRFKVIMGAGILGKRLLLLNASREHPTGTGYLADKSEPIIHTPFRVAQDMWWLDEHRLQTLKAAGISNNRLEELHTQAAGYLGKARAARATRRWDQFIEYSRAAWGYESRAYPDAASTANDVMKGILFYLFLILPFSYFLERLLFGFANIHKRIAATVLIFLGSFFLLRLIHPAFELASTPYIVLLAFMTLTLAAIVTWLIASRFGVEMQKVKRGRSEVYQTDVTRTSALLTAFTLGVSNMRNRPLRVFLTCLTIILLMFTVQSFTSVKTYLRFYKLNRPTTPSYEGALIRNHNWWPLLQQAYDYLLSEFQEEAILIPRAWFPPLHGEMSTTFVMLEGQTPEYTEKLRQEQKMEGTPYVTYARFILGLSPQEPLVSRIDQMLSAGTWFQEGDREVCILPQSMADLLGIKSQDVGQANVWLFGRPLLVKGILDEARFDSYRDLDGEALTPVNFKALSPELNRQIWRETSRIEGEKEILSFEHLPAANVLIVPYDYLRDLGGNIMSTAIKFKSGYDPRKGIEAFMPRLGLIVFAALDGKVSVYSALALTSFSGLGNLFVPVLIAALIVLNTMMGAVHERFREIGIFSAVGLAPTHIAVLFMAEACVYAIIGGMAGYLLGQTSAEILTTLGLAGSLTLNYSSMAAVTSTALVMGVVLLSTVYPARKASQMAVPDVERSWRFPTPEGDTWRFDFPFTISGTEVVGLFVYLHDFFRSSGEESIGKFYTDHVSLSSFETPLGEGYLLDCKVWLAPFDIGISESVFFRAKPIGEFNVYEIKLEIVRLSGDIDSWYRINRRFLNIVRKQFLIWRTIEQSIKDQFKTQGQHSLSSAPVSLSP